MTQTFGQLVRDARSARGLTTTQLGDIAGVAQATVSRVETGTRHADPATVDKLVAALKLPDYAPGLALLEARAAFSGQTVEQAVASTIRAFEDFKRGTASHVVYADDGTRLSSHATADEAAAEVERLNADK